MGDRRWGETYPVGSPVELLRVAVGAVDDGHRIVRRSRQFPKNHGRVCRLCVPEIHAVRVVVDSDLAAASFEDVDDFSWREIEVAALRSEGLVPVGVEGLVEVLEK